LFNDWRRLRGGGVTGISRQTKDFDLYLRRQHVDLALDALKCAGYKENNHFHIGSPKLNATGIVLI